MKGKDRINKGCTTILTITGSPIFWAINIVLLLIKLINKEDKK